MAPERDRRRPGHPRLHPARDPATATVVQSTQTTTRPTTGIQIVAQVARRGVVGRVQQHRRDEQRQREFRVERDLRQPGHHGAERAGQRQQRRIGRAAAAAPNATSAAPANSSAMTSSKSPMRDCLDPHSSSGNLSAHGRSATISSRGSPSENGRPSSAPYSPTRSTPPR